MYFDDILVTDSLSIAEEWTEKTWGQKKKSIAAESVSIPRIQLHFPGHNSSNFNRSFNQVTLKGRILKQMNFKPGWWAAYAIYCLVPVTLYILYMRDVIRKVSNQI